MINAKSVENALRVILAIGGSTNAVIHLTRDRGPRRREDDVAATA